jgi:hypothetical protein
VDVYLRLRDLPTTGGVPDMPLELYASDDATTTDLLSGTPLVSIPSLDGIHFATVDLSAAPASAGKWLTRIAGSNIPSFLARTVTVETTTYKHLNPSLMEDLYIVLHGTS